MKYEPTPKSIRQHKVPKWYHDAKLGIFIHWGTFSVPAYAVTGMNIVESRKERSVDDYFKHNPYAEWYLNTLRIDGSPTQEYHKEKYGDNFSYDSFAPIFNKEIKKWNPKDWASLFKKIGAKYVVLTTKHCEGFLLWPSKYKHPNKENYFASRDIVGELTEAVKKEGLNMGFYYSSAWDWSFNLFPILDTSSFIKHYEQSLDYAKYVTNHWYELIDDYRPEILWSDMGYPDGIDIYEIFAYFYNKITDGVVNNRWNQYIPEEKKFRYIKHYDFTTPEYEVEKKIKKKKWEVCRGIGNSFGYNRYETEEDYLSATEIIYMLVDIVSKNGNLLLNVGPTAEGKIPEIQKQRLLELGEWLEVNGDAIFNTRPWSRAEGTTTGGIPVRFTRNKDILYAILLGKPEKEEILINDLGGEEISQVNLLGVKENLVWRPEGNDLFIKIPNSIQHSPAISFKIAFK